MASEDPSDWNWKANSDWNPEAVFNSQYSWAPRRDICANSNGELLSHTKQSKVDYSETLKYYEQIIGEMRKRKPKCVGCGRDYTPEQNLKKFGCRVHLCQRDLNEKNEETFACTGLPTNMPHLSVPCVPCVHTSTKEAFETYVLLGNENFIAIPVSLADIPARQGGLDINEKHIAGRTEHNVYFFCTAERQRIHNRYDLNFLERIRALEIVYLGDSMSITEQKRIIEMPVEHILTMKQGETTQIPSLHDHKGFVWETPLDVFTTEQLQKFFDSK